MTSYLFERVDGPLLLPDSYSKIFYEIAEYLNEAELGVEEPGVDEDGTPPRDYKKMELF